MTEQYTINTANIHVNAKKLPEVQSEQQFEKQSDNAKIEINNDSDTMHIAQSSTDFNIMHKTKTQTKNTIPRVNHNLNKVIVNSMNNEK